MQTQLKIDTYGAALSAALQRKIADHVADLEHMYGRLTACHVSLEPPGHHQRKGGLFHVSIHLALPDGREVSVGKTPTADKRHSNIQFALNDAFRRARRQLQDHARKMHGHVKIHGAQPSGTVTRFDPNSGFGFIEADDGHEVYFHKNSIIGGRPSQVRRGARVTFVEELGEKGAQASTVRRLGKHATR